MKNFLKTLLLAISIFNGLQADPSKIYPKDYYRLDITYANKLKVSDQLDFALVKFEPAQEEAILEECELLEENQGLIEKFGSLIDIGHEEPTYVKFLPLYQFFGAFADADIAQGQLIAEYTGIIKAEDDACADSSYSWGYYPGESCQLCIDSYETGNITRFVNHSENPNIDVVYVLYKKLWHLLYVANCDIKKDQQLFVHYGYEYWNYRPKLKRIVFN